MVASADLFLVHDMSGTLSDSQISQLNTRATRISNQYNCFVAIYVEEGMGIYNNPINPGLRAEELFNEIVPDNNGILLYLSFYGTDTYYYLIANGYGNTAFTDYGKDVMLDNHILPLLRNSRYYDAFSTYLDKAEEFLSMARNGTPFDVHTDPNAQGTSILVKLAIIILIPLFIAFLVCSYWKSQMKTARIATTACNYIPPGGFQLTNSADTFLYQTVTRTKIQSSSSSGGGTTTNSRGFSGRGGKF